MNKHRRLGDSEINLTPLLDVLFTILFIVMIGGAQNIKETEEEAKQQVEQSSQQVMQLQGQMEQLQSEIVELEGQIEQKQQQLESYDVHKEQAVVLTMQNIVEEGIHKLIIAKETETENNLVIPMGKERLDYVSNRIGSYVSEIVAGNEEQPVYIVFYCDKGTIYTAEYINIEEQLQQLQRTYKEVFYKTIEGE